ncbi:MAG: hypothetical protein NT027_13510 [Proteobacteria bacterium]|nr:hypothetical protein [Pseudomonadota bacterium]
MEKFLIGLSLVFASSVAYSQQRADLRTKMIGPAQLQVGVSAHYDISVFSKGQVAMPGSYTIVYLPSGATVPNKPSNCILQSGNRLKCSYGTLPALGNAIPAATLAIDIVASAPQSWALKAESKGTMADYTPADSISTINIVVSAPVQSSITINPPQNVKLDGCTFTGPASPSHTFALCNSGNLWSHEATFNSQGAYTVQGDQVGNWSQLNSESLKIEFQDAGQPVSAVYQGVTISPTCFEGTGTFNNNSNYHSAFRACLQP